MAAVRRGVIFTSLCESLLVAAAACDVQDSAPSGAAPVTAATPATTVVPAPAEPPPPAEPAVPEVTEETEPGPAPASVLTAEETLRAQQVALFEESGTPADQVWYFRER